MLKKHLGEHGATIRSRLLESRYKPGVIAKGSNQVRDPEQKRKENAEGCKNGEAVSQCRQAIVKSRPT
jgi:hypothetical protein